MFFMFFIYFIMGSNPVQAWIFFQPFFSQLQKLHLQLPWSSLHLIVLLLLYKITDIRLQANAAAGLFRVLRARIPNNSNKYAVCTIMWWC